LGYCEQAARDGGKAIVFEGFLAFGVGMRSFASAHR
jgi:hypothetical protein